MNDIAKAFAIAHRMGHDRPDVPEELRHHFRLIARLLWKSVGPEYADRRRLYEASKEAN